MIRTQIHRSVPSSGIHFSYANRRNVITIPRIRDAIMAFGEQFTGYSRISGLSGASGRGRESAERVQDELEGGES